MRRIRINNTDIFLIQESGEDKEFMAVRKSLPAWDKRHEIIRSALKHCYPPFSLPSFYFSRFYLSENQGFFTPHCFALCSYLDLFLFLTAHTLFWDSVATFRMIWILCMKLILLLVPFTVTIVMVRCMVYRL
jgi:hypothetical protein